jgi:hypothetical protein
MRIYHNGSAILGVVWADAYAKVDAAKLPALSIEIDEAENNATCVDVSRWWDRGKYTIVAGALNTVDGWTPPAEVPYVPPTPPSEE